MIFRNYTPFPPVHFDSRDENQRDYGVLVLRGTFMFRHGHRAHLLESQDPLVWKDEYFGDPQETALRVEGVLAPFKPATDVLIHANAMSPSGRAESTWTVAASVGDVTKTLVVTGERRWQKRLGMTGLGAIQPALSVPIRYELAFGGNYVDSPGEVKRWPDNPVGRGFPPKDRVEGALAPQIFASEADVHKLAAGSEIESAGFGPIAPHWAPRCHCVGTYNEMWRRTRFPDLPSDFQFSYFNTGSKGLVFDPFLKGDERIELVNLTDERRTVFALPGYQLATILRFENGEILPGPVMLDTVNIDAVQQIMHLTWRSVYPVDPAVRVLEVRVKDTYGV